MSSRLVVLFLTVVACCSAVLVAPTAAQGDAEPTGSVPAQLAELGLVRLQTIGATRTHTAAAPASTSDSRPDPLGDVIAGDGSQTVEPRSDISALTLQYGADRLDVSVTIPGGVDPATSPNWRGNLSGIVTAIDVNGDDDPDFASVLVVDKDGIIRVLTISVPPTPAPATAARFEFCAGTGTYDAASRTYRLAIPSTCLGNAYEARAAAVIFFNRATSVMEKFDLTLDLAPASDDIPGVHRDTAKNGAGYRFVAGDGGIFAFGNATFLGSTGDIRLNQPIVGMDSTRSGQGYWLVASDGGIFTFGDAAFVGSTGDIRLNQPITAMAATPTGNGYWLVARDGGIFTFGDAAFHGSAASYGLTTRVVDMAATPTGRGYWIVNADGAVFPFGDATFFTSTTGATQPVVGIAATPSGRGYWLAHADGGISPRGDAMASGETANLRLNAPIVGLEATPTGRGYWLLGRDGGVFSFGDAAFHGSTGDLRLNQPVLALTT